MYAVGQGALAVECRENDQETLKLLTPLYDLHTALRVVAERSFMRTLGGGCSAPVAVTSTLTNVKGIEYRLSLKGGVWSLDGTEEVKDEGDCSLHLKDLKRCATCPFNNRAMTTSIEDIECLKECVKCPNSPISENPSKKARYEVPSEVLKNDPHEKCPVQMPIGADFMGKCPYLEAGMVHAEGKCPVNGSIEGAAALPDKSQCPFMMRNGKIDVPQLAEKLQSLQESDNLFCGLVSHKDASLETFRSALLLGKSLAQKLTKKGAVEIMTKAQAVIHSSIPTSS